MEQLIKNLIKVAMDTTWNGYEATLDVLYADAPALGVSIDRIRELDRECWDEL